MIHWGYLVLVCCCWLASLVALAVQTRRRELRIHRRQMAISRGTREEWEWWTADKWPKPPPRSELMSENELQWTAKLPTEVGFYWCREPKSDNTDRIIQVFKMSHGLAVFEYGNECETELVPDNWVGSCFVGPVTPSCGACLVEPVAPPMTPFQKQVAPGVGGWLQGIGLIDKDAEGRVTDEANDA